MSTLERPRELAINQSHVGTTLLAGMIALVATCLAATVVVALIWLVASRSGWMLCLMLPAIGLISTVGIVFLQWGERNLPRVWPSGKRLVLNHETLTLQRGGRVKLQIVWHERPAVLRWRVRLAGSTQEAGSWPRQLCLACQLRQKGHTFSLYTACSSQDWRRVPGWKQFPLLEGGRRPSQGAFLGETQAWLPPQRPATPLRHQVGSLPQADPRTLWPAEQRRQRMGWELSFEDFCAVMAAVEQFVEA